MRKLNTDQVSLLHGLVTDVLSKHPNPPADKKIVDLLQLSTKELRDRIAVHKTENIQARKDRRAADKQDITRLTKMRV